MIKIPLLFMAASAALAYASTAQQNKQQKQIVDYQNRMKDLAYQKSIAFNKASNEIKAVNERAALSMRYDAMRGASLAQGAERSTLTSQSQTQVLNALGYTAARESARISLEEQMANIGYEINAQPQYGVAGSASPWLAGISGGLSGLSMGMGVQGSYEQMQANRAMQAATTPGQGSTGLMGQSLLSPDVYTGMGSQLYTPGGIESGMWRGIPYR